MEMNDKIPAGNPFRVPENYLEEVKSKIISATSGEVKQEEKNGIYVRLRTFIAIAASVAIIALLSYTGFVIFSPPPAVSLSLDRIKPEMYQDIIVNEVDITTIEDKAAWLDLPEVRQLADKEEIFDYLVTENIDVNDIYELL